MDERLQAEMAAIPAILQYLMSQRKPAHDNTSDPLWRSIFDDANYLAYRFSAAYARSHHD